MESAAALLLLLGVFGCCRGLQLIEECSGNNVTFTAAASDRPLQIHWFKDNSEIMEVKEGRKPFYYILQDRIIVDLRRRTLILKNVTPADSGRYRAAVLVGGTLENTDFRLRVDDLCNITIYDVPVENKVKLQCACSSPSAVPSECKWYKWDSGNDHLVSDECSITVRKEEKTQLYKCVACNKVSNKYAIFTVPIKEPDPVCNVTIHNITVENNVTLQCACSSSGAAPAKYEWYKWDSGNYRNVSDECSITVPKEEKTQLYKCVASYEVSNNSDTFTVPTTTPEPLRQLHAAARLLHTGIYVLIATLVLAFIIIIIIVAILLLKKINKEQHRHRMEHGQPGPGAERGVLLKTPPPQSSMEEHPAAEPQFSPESEASPALVAPLCSPEPVVEEPAHRILESVTDVPPDERVAWYFQEIRLCTLQVTAMQSELDGLQERLANLQQWGVHHLPATE